ncbi:GNAT family N-acetyltransferase [Streptomyces sp. NPDC053431]|uniref:GNAT family N-acetyltransferase n=1 Tax=Streptomyces sp. NPDC053431 TaxID=3365703 RepID=UPI0037D03123
MSIRRALPSDAASIAAVHVRSWQAAYRGLVPDPYLKGLDVAERTEVWRERLTGPAAPVVLVAEDESGSVTAFASFRPWPDGEGDTGGGEGGRGGEGEGGGGGEGAGGRGGEGEGEATPLDAAVTAELSTLYAAPEAWGRGVGRALLAATVEAMRGAGFRDAGLWVFEENSRARAFYERAGWRTDGESVTEDTGGRTLRELRYALPLFG